MEADFTRIIAQMEAGLGKIIASMEAGLTKIVYCETTSWIDQNNSLLKWKWD